jgi:hypothetical protein
MNFAEEVRAMCAPAYAEVARDGRPGIDPVVYSKMLMIGFFEASGKSPHAAPTPLPARLPRLRAR